MHTMHHRSGKTMATSVMEMDNGSLLPSSRLTTNPLSAVNVPTTAVSPALLASPEKQRRRKRSTNSSSSQRMIVSLARRDLVVAIFSACFLTVLSVLILLKIYTSWVAPNSNSGRSLVGGQANGPPVVTTTTEDDGSYDESEILPWNPRYRVPGSMRIVGDRSNSYVDLRQSVDGHLPFDATRSTSFVSNLVSGNMYTNILSAATQEVHHSDAVAHSATYDINNCPPKPPPGYPYAWTAQTVLENWPPDDVSPPASGMIYQGLCVFDYSTDYDTALRYRTAEVPFVVINDPAVAATVERWNRPGYMEQLMGSVLHRTEYSENNHFMYYVPPPKHQNRRRASDAHLLAATKNTPKDWKAPTKMLRMTYANWLSHANVSDDKLGPHNPHWYYRLIGCGGTGNDGSCDKGSSEYLFDELTFFQPRESLYIVEPEEQKGYEE
jgi:hypothetical protein